MSQTKSYNRRKDDQKGSHQLRSLQLLNAYRLIIAILLFSFNYFEITFIGRIQPDSQYFLLSSFYLAFSLLCFFISSSKIFKLIAQVHTNVLIDVISIAIFTLMSGGISSGLGTLILAPIAGASLLIPGQTALLFASYGTVALILQELYGDISGYINSTSYSQTGLIGIALFATAFLAITLARRVSDSTALAERRGIDLANLSQLNEHLINRIDSGIIVIDEKDSIRLMNRSASKLLNTGENIHNLHLQSILPSLHSAHKQWLDSLGKRNETKIYDIPRPNQPPLKARISKVGARAEDRGSVIYLSDTSEINQQIQETKLASLGRLTASIAHEIRNPLGAISHAAQLLDESENVSEDNRRLTNIIHDQTNRLNSIIESVLRLSRKQDACLEEIPLEKWMQKFIKEFTEFNQLSSDWYILDIENHLTVYSDPNHLHQTMWNICTNAIKHTFDNNQNVTVKLKGYKNSTTLISYLDIIDNGPGVNPDNQEKLFEPFYTTSSSGTGLGLYISRELCLSTGGDLTYNRTRQGGSCFRIRFANSKQY